MKHLVIIGAGGYGREMFHAARESLGFGTRFDIRGFLDGRADALDGFANYPPIIGTPETYVPQPDDVFITALGNIDSRRRCVQLLEAHGAEFETIIHRTAVIGGNVTIGSGSFIAPGVCLTADIAIGAHAAVFHNTSIGHDSVLEDFTHVYAQCSIGGSVRVCTGASVYPGSVIVPRRTIGATAVVGAGSTVFLNVPSGVTVLGNPAKPINLYSSVKNGKSEESPIK